MPPLLRPYINNLLFPLQLNFALFPLSLMLQLQGLKLLFIPFGNNLLVELKQLIILRFSHKPSLILLLKIIINDLTCKTSYHLDICLLYFLLLSWAWLSLYFLLLILLLVLLSPLWRWLKLTLPTTFYLHTLNLRCECIFPPVLLLVIFLLLTQYLL